VERIFEAVLANDSSRIAAIAARTPLAAAENLLTGPPAVAADSRLQVGGDRAGVVDAVVVAD
jgi:hypothetical protein